MLIISKENALNVYKILIILKIKAYEEESATIFCFCHFKITHVEQVMIFSLLK